MMEEYDQRIPVQIQAIVKIYLSYVKSVGKGDSITKPKSTYTTDKDFPEGLEELYQKLALIYIKQEPDEESKESIIDDIKQRQKKILLAQKVSDIDKRTRFLDHIPKCLHITIRKYNKEEKFEIYQPKLDGDGGDDDDDDDDHYVEIKWDTPDGRQIDRWITKLYRNKGNKGVIETTNSEIINKDHIKLFIDWINKKDQSANTGLNNKYEFKLIYRSNRDGLNAGEFHKKCDNISGTITVAKINNTDQILGGYNPVSWNIVYSAYYSVNDSFIFNIPSLNNLTTAKIGRPTNLSNSIYCNQAYMSTFGGGHDLYLNQTGSYCINPYGYTSIGLPNQRFDFNITGCEVFQVISKT